jgi:ferredoxin-type protein NapH
MKKILLFRRFFQIITFLMIFVIPYLNLKEINFIKGTFYSIDVGDVAMADPLAIFQAVISSKIINMYMIASILIPLLLMITLGRIWCSWFCPYYFMVEMLEKIRKLVGLKSLKPKYNKSIPSKTNIIRFTFLIIGIIVTGIAGIPLLNLISAPGVISSEALVVVKFHHFTFEIVFILVILVIEFLFVYKFWCRFFCPTGTFLSIFRWKKGMKVIKKQPECTMCLNCIKICPMALNPMEEGDNSLCNNCGDCIVACEKNNEKTYLKFDL